MGVGTRVERVGRGRWTPTSEPSHIMSAVRLCMMGLFEVLMFSRATCNANCNSLEEVLKLDPGARVHVRN